MVFRPYTDALLMESVNIVWTEYSIWSQTGPRNTWLVYPSLCSREEGIIKIGLLIVDISRGLAMCDCIDLTQDTSD